MFLYGGLLIDYKLPSFYYSVHPGSNGYTPRTRINPDVAENLNIRTWANWSKRLRGEPSVQGALTSKAPAGVHFYGILRLP